MGRLLRFLNLIVALGLGFAIGVGVGWLNGQANPAKFQLQFRSRESFKITGIIDILPELRNRLKSTDTLLIVVTNPGSKAPIAVKRVYPVSLPFLYTIGPEDRVHSILPGLLPEQVELNVRVGNLVGKPSESSFMLPARDLHVLIDRVVE